MMLHESHVSPRHQRWLGDFSSERRTMNSRANSCRSATRLVGVDHATCRSVNRCVVEWHLHCHLQWRQGGRTETLMATRTCVVGEWREWRAMMWRRTLATTAEQRITERSTVAIWHDVVQDWIQRRTHVVQHACSPVSHTISLQSEAAQITMPYKDVASRVTNSCLLSRVTV